MKHTMFTLLAYAFLFTSCSEEPWLKQGDIVYRKLGDSWCTGETKNHWLMDLSASNSQDSVFLNTRTLKRKIEVHKLQMDSTSDLYKILSNLCEGDSIQLKLKSKDFYQSMNGLVPSYLSDDEKISVKVLMQDKLSDIEHVSYKQLFELKSIAQYAKNNRWNGTKDSTTNIYFERLKTNINGQTVKNRAKVKYEISSLNEQILAYSKEGEPLLYESSDAGLLKGIHFLVLKLKEGESVRALIPSEQAFGADGNDRIPGYMPILIELEILESL